MYYKYGRIGQGLGRTHAQNILDEIAILQSADAMLIPIRFTGSMDCTARLWSINAGSTLTTFRGHVGAILCLAVDNDKRLLFTGRPICSGYTL